MASRTVTYQNQVFTWNDETALQIENGTVGQINLLAVNTQFSGALQWSGSQPNGSAVSLLAPDQLLLSVPNSLEEGDKTYHFSVVCSPRQQTSNLTLLLKGYPG